MMIANSDRRQSLKVATFVSFVCTGCFVKSMEAKCVYLYFCTFCVLSATASVNSWFFDDSDVDDDDSDDQPVLSATIPFELNTADDYKLLQEATKNIAKDLSALNACHHRVVLELEGRCSDLSEEELAKLSVRLFNCQAAAGERPTYRCTSDMTVADCTRDMDPTTWNAFQVY